MSTLYLGVIENFSNFCLNANFLNLAELEMWLNWHPYDTGR